MEITKKAVDAIINAEKTSYPMKQPKYDWEKPHVFPYIISSDSSPLSAAAIISQIQPKCFDEYEDGKFVLGKSKVECRLIDIITHKFTDSERRHPMAKIYPTILLETKF